VKRTRIKICGISTVETALAAAEAGADAIGLVFVEASARCVDIATATKIVASLPPLVEPIGLFVDESAEKINTIMSSVGLRSVQLHGNEGPHTAAKLGDASIIKAVPFDPQTLHEKLAPWQDSHQSLAAVLLDTPPTATSATTGGHGRVFDWQALVEMIEQGELADFPPLFLAGGLTPENVGDAIAKVKPYAVDVSTGVESARGVKDIGLIAAFCHAVREADANLQNP